MTGSALYAPAEKVATWVVGGTFRRKGAVNSMIRYSICSRGASSDTAEAIRKAPSKHHLVLGRQEGHAPQGRAATLSTLSLCHS